MTDRVGTSRNSDKCVCAAFHGLDRLARVNTTDIHNYLTSAIEASRNPTTRRLLGELQNLIASEGKNEAGEPVAHNALSLKQADDLRKKLEAQGQSQAPPAAPAR